MSDRITLDDAYGRTLEVAFAFDEDDELSVAASYGEGDFAIVNLSRAQVRHAVTVMRHALGDLNLVDAALVPPARPVLTFNYAGGGGGGSYGGASSGASGGGGGGSAAGPFGNTGPGVVLN